MDCVSYSQTMKHQPIHIAKLLAKKIRYGLSPDQEQQLADWMAQHPDNKHFAQELLEKAERGIDLSILDSFNENAALNRFKRQTRPRYRRLYWSAVASILIGISAWYIVSDPGARSSKQDRYSAIEDKRHKNDVLPAEIGAYLVRSNGKQLEVDSSIIVLDNGRINSESGYLIAEREKADTAGNTLVVPAAHFFAVTLSDGTKVWVNANSELRFPSRFSGRERRVELKGEAYFEVAQQEKPFLVKSRGMETRVLGTHFNVNAYNQTPSTTLLEGRVAVRYGPQQKELIPGQKAMITVDGIQIDPANVRKAVAWKDNIFQFKGDNIVEIAQQLKNWYNLEVSLLEDVSLTKTYSGEISRDVKLSEVLKMLEYASQLDFRIEENKLLILNKKA